MYENPRETAEDAFDVMGNVLVGAKGTAMNAVNSLSGFFTHLGHGSGLGP